jgi:endonuclease-3
MGQERDKMNLAEVSMEKMKIVTYICAPGGGEGPAEEARIGEILDRLATAYPEAACALDFKNPYQLLAAVTLSAQTTDKSVNRVSPELFRRYPDPFALAEADPEELGALLRPVGMYKTKSRNLIAQAKALVERHGGQVPGDYEALTALPGVGRKTANVVLSVGFGEQRIAVDTHVQRLANRIGLARSGNVLDTEKQLMARIPESRWTEAHHALIFHGRNCCAARNPACGTCPIGDLCPREGVLAPEEAKVMKALDRLGIPYVRHTHEACFTVEQAKAQGLNRPGINVKNLVLRDPRDGKHYMVILADERRLDFRQFAGVTGWSKKTTFASDEEIFHYLGVHIGSCSVFGVLNDKENHVIVVLEKAIAGADIDAVINFHPNVNTSTLSLSVGDMYRFLEWAGNPVLLEEDEGQPGAAD